MINIAVARKPLSESTVARNVLEWGTGGFNICSSRIGLDPASIARLSEVQTRHSDTFLNVGGAKSGSVNATYKPEGRWPSNLILSICSAEDMDNQSGFSQSPPLGTMRISTTTIETIGIGSFTPKGMVGHGDKGGASRFFKVIKPDVVK